MWTRRLTHTYHKHIRRKDFIFSLVRLRLHVCHYFMSATILHHRQSAAEIAAQKLLFLLFIIFYFYSFWFVLLCGLATVLLSHLNLRRGCWSGTLAYFGELALPHRKMPKLSHKRSKACERDQINLNALLFLQQDAARKTKRVLTTTMPAKQAA